MKRLTAATTRFVRATRIGFAKHVARASTCKYARRFLFLAVITVELAGMQSFLCLKLHADEANGSIQCKMTQQSRLLGETVNDCKRKKDFQPPVVRGRLISLPTPNGKKS